MEEILRISDPNDGEAKQPPVGLTPAAGLLSGAEARKLNQQIAATSGDSDPVVRRMRTGDGESILRLVINENQD